MHSHSAYHKQRIDQRNLSPADGIYTYGSDGAGVDVYILDTGIRIEHEQFEGRASHGIDYTGVSQLNPL